MKSRSNEIRTNEICIRQGSPVPEIDFSQLTTFRIEFWILVHCGTLDESSIHPSFMFWKNCYLSHFSSWYFEFTRSFSEVYRINPWLAVAPKVSITKTEITKRWWDQHSACLLLVYSSSSCLECGYFTINPIIYGFHRRSG